MARLKTDRAAELGYVSEAVRLVGSILATILPVIGFCGAPFTLASYMIEGTRVAQLSANEKNDVHLA